MKGSKSSTPTKSSFVRAPKKRRWRIPILARDFAGSNSAAIPMPPATCQTSSARFTSSRYSSSKKPWPRCQQTHFIPRSQFRHQLCSAPHDFIEKLNKLRTVSVAAHGPDLDAWHGISERSHAALHSPNGGLYIIDAHGSPEQRRRISHQAYHGKLSRARRTCLSRSMQTQKKVTAGERPIFRHEHDLIRHHFHASRTHRMRPWTTRAVAANESPN